MYAKDFFMLPVDPKFCEFKQQCFLSALVELHDGLFVGAVVHELQQGAESEAVVLDPLTGRQFGDGIRFEACPWRIVERL